ncbi:hypothetical protein [Natronosalvus halobius]|uniref:hypothetical protein n=1 Tax=Natronosalvus halobius TaxID=2953746 RepID=UPI00209D510B|nr:hypothetical protein [Natronosalvus halobius]USZ73796.1 hypothetical protein NGM15_18490 [Natronosalvus halobius]
MRATFKRLATLLLVLSVITGGMVAFAGFAAAETTTLAGDDTDLVTGFEANESDHLEYDITADGTDFDTDGTDTAHLNVTYDGTEYAALEDAIDNGTATSQTLNLSHDELEKLPGDALQNTTITVNVWGEDADGNETTAMETFTVDLEFANTHAVRHIDSSDSTLLTEFEQAEEDDGWFSLSSLALWNNDLEDQAEIEDEIGIDGQNTDVKVYADGDVADVLDASLENAEDGDRVGLLMLSSLDDEPVYVFKGEAGEKITGDEVDENDSYIVAHEGGEMDVNLGDDHEGEETVDVSLISGQDVDASTLQDLGYSMLQSYGISMHNVPYLGGFLTGGFGGALIAGGLVVSRRRLSA